MNNPELIILKELNTTPDSLVPEGALHTFVNLQLVEVLTLSELRAKLASLEAANQVVGVTVEQVRKWKIAALGRARLAEAGL